ncbi:MAG: hypothetical protein EFT35_01745, partial [Methanophagales archaeon ANME-1-THS]
MEVIEMNNVCGEKMKHTIALVIIVALVGILIQTVSAARVSVEPVYLKGAPGEEFTVNITVDPEGSEIFGAQYELHFNTELLKATAQTKGPFLSQDGAGTTVLINKIDNVIGRLEYGETRTGVTSGVNKSGVLATIGFEAITAHGGVSELRLENAKLSDPEAKPTPAEVNNGSIALSSYNFDGFPVTTRVNGTVHGGIFIDYEPWTST